LDSSDDEEEGEGEAEGEGEEAVSIEGSSSDELPDSSDDEATTAAPVPAVRQPRKISDLRGSVVLVPRAQYPAEECSEHDGQGWSAKVMATKHGTARLKFACGDETVYFPAIMVLGWQQMQ
jgi:hypothetical protein